MSNILTMSDRERKKLSKMQNDITMESIVDVTIHPAPENDDSTAVEVNFKADDDTTNICNENPSNEEIQNDLNTNKRSFIKRAFSDATEEFLEGRRKKEKTQETVAKTKIRIGYVISAIVLTVLWVGYLGTAIFLLYGFINGKINPNPISLDQAFNDTYRDGGNCTNKSSAFDKFSIFVNALTNSSYNSSPFPVGECPTDFVKNRTHCTPECLQFTPGGHPMLVAFRVTTILGSSLTIIATIIGMLSWLLKKALWEFPKIVNFYMMISVLLQGIAILSGAILPKQFYCSNPNIDEARRLSTYPCLIQGAVMHYAILSFLLWYIFSISNLALIVLSPIKGARWFFNHKHKIHIAELIIAWGSPILVILITVIASAAEDELRSVYSIENVPEFCFVSDTIIQIASLHVLGFIFCLFNGTMITIVVLILIKLKYKQKTLTKYTTVNTEWVLQLSIFTLIFSLSIWIVLLDSSIYIFYENIYEKLLRTYTQCVTLFPSECCRATYQEFYVPWLSVLGGFSTCIWGIGGLTAVTNKEVRQFWKRAFTRICKCRKT